MQLLVGLGNPSLDNKNNRHNIGFKVIDANVTIDQVKKAIESALTEFLVTNRVL